MAVVVGNVIVVESVPARVSELFAVRVFAAAIVKTPVPVVNVFPFTVVATRAPTVCVPVKVFAASVLAIVAEVDGNVMTVESVPESVNVFVTASVLALVRVNVPVVVDTMRPFREVAVATPSAGVTNAGDVAKTNTPVPVSSVTAVIRFADEGVARNAATPDPKPLIPVPTGSPVVFVNTPLAGVPSAGVTSVGDVANTSAPEPVSSVTAVARLALDGAPRKVAIPAASPDTPDPIGSPVALVSVPLDGVPRAGVTRVADVALTIAPVPVFAVTAIPAIARLFPVVSNVLLVNVSVVSLPTRVSVAAGNERVTVPNAPVTGCTVTVPEVAFFIATAPTTEPAVPRVAVPLA